MGILIVDLYRELQNLEPHLREIFFKILEKIDQVIGETVRREDFLELKNIVEKISNTLMVLAEAQRRTEEKVEALAKAQKKTEESLEALAEAQRRTEEKVEALAETQRKTEERLNALSEKVEALAEAQRKTEEKLNALSEKVEALAEAQRRTEEELRKLIEEHRKTRGDLEKLRKDFGGFTTSISYAFENEAYRHLPSFLKEKYGIEVIERFIRTRIKGEEINFFAKGKFNGKEVYIIGESKIRFEEKKKDFEKTLKQLKKKEKALKETFGEVEIVKLIVTHFATKEAIDLAEKEKIIVVQSFEW